MVNGERVVRNNLPNFGSGIDGWINMDYSFLGLDLAATPWQGVTNFAFTWAVIGLILIPILAGGSQLVMSRVMMKQQPQEGAAASSTKMMMWMMPLFSVYIAFMMPAALGVYWIAQSVFSLVQEVVLGKFFQDKIEAEEEARYAAIQEDRKRRQEEGRRRQEEQRNLVVQKQTLKEKRKAAQDAKTTKKKNTTSEAGRVGDRPYARGRSYKEDRYDETN